MKKIIPLLFLFIVMTISVHAVCTVTFDKETYFPASTVTATMTCSEGAEKSQAFVLNCLFGHDTLAYFLA